MKKILFGLFLMVVVMHELQAVPSLELSVNKNIVAENSSLILNVSLQDQKFNQEPDFSLVKQDFNIIRRSKNRSTTNINGKVSSSINWQLLLMPKKLGEIKIPEIRIANLVSNSITIKVVPATAGNGTDNQLDLAFMEAEVDNQAPIVQSQTNLTVKLYYAKSIAEGSLSDLIVPDSIIVPLGKEVAKKINKNGIVMHMVERKYAIFPQKSGTMKINMPVFNGVFDDRSTGMNSFDDLFRISIASTPVTTTAAPITLKVKEAQNQQGHWLPANQLTHTQQWEDKPEVKVGEPVLRTITLHAKGLTAEQLPNLNVDDMQGVSIYQESNHLNEEHHDEYVNSKKIIQITYIPSEVGTLSIPDIQIPWWNTSTNTMQTLLISGKDLNIIAKAAVSDTKLAADDTKLELKSTNIWVYLFSGMLTLWLATIAIWLYLKYKPKYPRSKASGNKITKQQLYSQIESHCQQGEAKLAYNKIMQLASLQLAVPVSNTSELPDTLSPMLKAELIKLEEHLYGKPAKAWDGKLLGRLIQEAQFRPIKSQKKDAGPLPPLNPQ